MLDVSSTTGQVFLVLDPRRSSPTKRDGGGGRRDWLILMRFEQAVGKCIERGSQQVCRSDSQAREWVDMRKADWC